MNSESLKRGFLFCQAAAAESLGGVNKLHYCIEVPYVSVHALHAVSSTSCVRACVRAYSEKINALHGCVVPLMCCALLCFVLLCCAVLCCVA